MLEFQKMAKHGVNVSENFYIVLHRRKFTVVNTSTTLGLLYALSTKIIADALKMLIQVGNFLSKFTIFDHFLSNLAKTIIFRHRK